MQYILAIILFIQPLMNMWKFGCRPFHLGLLLKNILLAHQSCWVKVLYIKEIPNTQIIPHGTEVHEGHAMKSMIMISNKPLKNL